MKECLAGDYARSGSLGLATKATINFQMNFKG
jgi:hypothetical protein